MKNLIIVLLIATCGVITYLTYKSNTELAKSLNVLEQNGLLLANMSSRMDGMRNSLIWSVISEGEEIRNLDLTSEEGQQVRLKSLLFGTYTLVLYYSELHCSSCVEKQIKLLNKAAETIGSKNILISTSYTNTRELLLFKRMNQIKLPIYNLGSEGLGLSTDKVQSPVFFVLSKDLKTQNIFVPLEFDPELTMSYLDKIMVKYWAGIANNPVVER